MTHQSSGTRALHVEGLARVEGEGAMDVTVRDGRLVDVRLRIYEPPRFFEAFLRGRHYTEPPDITARVCGICPVAYQLSACNAIEAAAGVVVDGPIADLRRLLFCGEWIESHTLHIFFLHAPDFLGLDDAVALATSHPDLLRRALALKKAGNELVALVGGRPIHPVNVRVGGFFRAPSRRQLHAIRPQLELARDIAADTVAWVGDFDAPELSVTGELVALRQPGEYPITRGRLVSTGGLDIAPHEFPDHVVEEHVAHSTALHAHLVARGDYLVGPLARFVLNIDELAPAARAAAAAAGIDAGLRNPFRTIVVRAVEVLHACEEALAIIDRYEEPDVPSVPVEPGAGEGAGWTEAPRGVLWHRYRLDADGLIEDAKIVPPTAQNQPAIEHDLYHFVEANLDLPDDELARRCEQVIRNYDPCISCATHFLDLRVDRS